MTWTIWLLGGALALLVAFALLAPLESLRWWATRGAIETRRTFARVGAPAPPASSPLPDRFDTEDQAGLEALMHILIAGSDI